MVSANFMIIPKYRELAKRILEEEAKIVDRYGTKFKGAILTYGNNLHAARIFYPNTRETDLGILVTSEPQHIDTVKILRRRDPDRLELRAVEGFYIKSNQLVGIRIVNGSLQRLLPKQAMKIRTLEAPEIFFRMNEPLLN